VQQVISHEGNRVEIALVDEFTVEDFRQIVRQLESLSAAHASVHLLFDAT
jgi:hypothetical protein